MARKKGDLVVVYLEHLNQWVDAVIVDWIRGFGYSVNVELDGEMTTGTILFFFLESNL